MRKGRFSAALSVAGEPGLEPGFMVLETMRIAINSLPRGRRRLARSVWPACEHMFVPTRVHWPAALIGTALELAALGHTDATISAATGIPPTTVRNYRRRRPRRLGDHEPGVVRCARCGSPEHDLPGLDPVVYSYLLGIYLGDGCISENRQRFQLRIALDTAYPAIVDEVAAAVESIRGRRPGRVAASDGGAGVTIASGWKQWPCYFPQHGPGRKHERPIELVDWQRRHIDAAPESFLRGLIHSDGCRCVNRFETRLPSGRVRRYEYPRYFFSNLSHDILALFSDTCDLLDIRWTRPNHRNISISHRQSVARMDAFIGPKT